MRRTAERPHGSAGLFGAFLSLASAQVITTAAGFLFWLVAAHLVDARNLGVVAAAIAVSALLAKLLTMGLGTLLIVELPRLTPVAARAMLGRATILLTLLGIGGGMLSAGGVLLLSRIRGEDEPLQQMVVDPVLAALFVVLLASTTVATVLDQAVLGVNRASVQVVRNTIASLGRFPLLVGLALAGEVGTAGLLLTWVVPQVLSLVVAVVQLGLPGARDPGGRNRLRSLWRAALAHHLLNLALAAGPLLVPVIAAATLTAVGNAHFTIAWMVATFIFIPPYMLATALFSSTVNQGIDAFGTSIRRTLPLALGLSLGLCVGAWILGGLGLRAFGSEYAEGSTVLLWLLAPAGLWMVVKDHLVAQFRVEGRLGFATRLALASVVLEAAGALVGAHFGGARGLVLGWLVSALVQLVLAAGPVLALVRLALRARPVVEEAVDGARPVVVTNALVPDPVEGTQVMARKVVEHLVGSHDARLLVPRDRPVTPGLPEEPLFTQGWVPVRAMLTVFRQRPSAIVVVPDGGIDYRKLLHALLLGLAGMRRTQLVAVQRHRDFPSWVVRSARPFVTVVAGNEADRSALEESGFQTTLLTPPVDPGRISTVGRADARVALELPAERRIHLHVGHAKRGRNLTALAPLTTGDDHLVLVLSPFAPVEDGSLPVGPNLTVVRARVDVGLYYRAADVYVFPTYDPRNVIAFPMSIGEALANGLPVVAYRSPMTSRWDGDPRVALVDSDDVLLAAALSAPPAAEHPAAAATPSPFGTCSPACDLGSASPMRADGFAAGQPSVD